jgi:FAD-dependent urate hydroxylase
LRNSQGKHLGESRTGGVLPEGTTSHTIKRGDLYAALFGEATSRDLPVLNGKRLVAATQDQHGVRATFADGSEAFADLLVGADGLHSTVRTLIDAKAPAPAYSGLLTIGGYARGVSVDAGPGCYEMIFGKKAFFGYAAAPDGEVWWFANIPQRRQPLRGELAGITDDEWRRRLLDLFAEDAGPALALIEATPELSPVTAIHTVPHLPAWNRGRLVVVGDAAHAPSPTSGQGASLSIEDGVELARSLRGADDPVAALAAFAVGRRPRVERIIKWAARMNSSKAAGPVGAAVRDAMMPALMRMAAGSKANRSVHDYHIEW